MIALVPAYCRVYLTEEEVLKDWEGNKDFKIYGGPYCSIRDKDNLIKDFRQIGIYYGKDKDKYKDKCLLINREKTMNDKYLDTISFNIKDNKDFNFADFVNMLYESIYNTDLLIREVNLNIEVEKDTDHSEWDGSYNVIFTLTKKDD